MKLIKLELTSDYRLDDENGELIASTLEGAKTKLSKQNCDEIFGVVDVEKLAESHAEECYERNGDPLEESYFENRKYNFKEGFNKAMELNKDKLFTVDDLIIAFFIGRESLDKAIVTVEEAREKIISSLYSPTEIEVEICCYIGNGDKESDSFKDPLVTNTGIPKLDENDCLILKKK